MAGHEDTAKPGANGYDAGPADDLKTLLDSLAYEIKGTGTRHSEALHDMQGRVAAISDRASAVKPSLPHEYSAAIGRIEAAMSSFAERLSDSEPRATAASDAGDADGTLPETVRAELRHVIMNAHRPEDDAPPASHAPLYDPAGPERVPAPATDAGRRAFGESGEEVLAPPVTPAYAEHPTAAADAAIDSSWLEARFADIADRVEQSLAAHSPHNALLSIGARFDQLEQRFDRALVEITARPDANPDALGSVERQIGELAAQLEHAQQQLGRLDAIENRLTDLRQGISEEEVSRLVGTLVPTDQMLTATATAAAERVASTFRSADPERAAPEMASDPRLVELTVMLDTFIGEQRQGDAQSAEALDTMQQAMQHLIDRVEAIEAAQISHHNDLMSARATADSQEPQVFAVRTPDPIRAAPPPALSEPPTPEPSLAIEAPIVAPEPEPPAERSHQAQNAEPSQLPSPGNELDRQALIAMARRAAEKVSKEPPPPRAPRLAAGRSLPRPSLLLVVSCAAFLLAGFWLVAGPSLRTFLPSFSLGATRGNTVLPAKEVPARMSTPAPDDRPAGSDIAEADAAEPSVQPRMASLSARVVPQAAPASIVTTTTADLMGALAHGPRPPADVTPPPTPAPAPEMPQMSRSVEMPPALLGPLSLRNAAAKGDPKAQFEVAARFAEGKGIPQDFAQAATWYQRAATQGLAPAQYRLGALYERGLGVAADPARARVWYNRAAGQGNLRAMHNLAVLSAGRPGMSPDYPSAVQWFTEAANRGLADSQYNLGILYESGLGVPANNVEAYKWYALAARSGDKDAARRRDAVRAKLDAGNLKSADALVIQWRAKAVESDANDARMSGQGWQSVRR